MYIVVLIEVSTKEGAILRYFNIYNILMFIMWILPQITIRSFVFNQLEASFLTNQKLAWRSLKSGTRKYRPLVPRVNKVATRGYTWQRHV